MSEPLWLILAKVLVVFGITMTSVPLMVLAERRISAWIQYRIGPNRVGPFGALQPMADLLKMLFKEDMRPGRAAPFLFTAAPYLAAVCAFTMIAMVPFGGTLEVGGRQVKMMVCDAEIGVLAVLAVSSIGVYALTLGGWCSGSKYSLLGGLRSSAQMISYELTLGLSLLGVLLVAGPTGQVGSLSMHQIVAWQAADGLFGWNVFHAPVAFLLFTTSAFAETNRLPFDLPEAEPELVGGYHTEYSSLRFGLFFLGEYAAMFVASALIVALFLGGWHLPFLTEDLVVGPGGALLQVGAFLAKVCVFLFFFIHVRWTLPRFRYDQLMNLGWKVFVPVALANLLATGALRAFQVM